MDSNGLDLGFDGVVMSSSTVLIAIVVGIGSTLLASFLPVLRASRIAPLAALRDSAVDTSGTSKRRLVAGVIVSAARRRHRRDRDERRTTRSGRPGSGAGDPGRCRGPRPGRRPPGGGRAGPRPRAAPRSDRSSRPPQRDARPAPHVGQRVGTHGRHRRGGAVHHVRRLDQGVDRATSSTRTSAATSSSSPTTSAAPGSAQPSPTRWPHCPRSPCRPGWRTPSITADGNDVEPSVVDPADSTALLDLDVSQGSLDDLAARPHRGERALRRRPRPRRSAARVDAGFADGAIDRTHGRRALQHRR